MGVIVQTCFSGVLAGMLALVIACSGCSSGPDSEKKGATAEKGVFADKEWAVERERMVARQIEARGVKDLRVLDAMRKVERHVFVPEDERLHSYEDRPLPIGMDQTISQPYIVALMTELVEPKADQKVLEIGTGSGYQAAILGELTSQVYTIEIVKRLGLRAKDLLEELGYKNVHVRIGDGYRGWPEEAPFDSIMVTAAPEQVPQPLIDQLKQGGRLVIPVGKPFDQRLKVYVRTPDGVEERNSIAVRFVPMTGEALER